MIYKILKTPFSILLVAATLLAAKDVAASRQNAITRAISKVGPAVASINVIQIKEYRSSPFFNDPLFQLLFPEK